MLKTYGITFLPWITLAVVSGVDDRAGALGGLTAGLAVLAFYRRRGEPWNSMILECGTTAYMAALSVVAFTAPEAAVLDYGAALAIGWLAVIAWTGLALRRPFTEGIARRQVPAEIAATDLFRRIMYVVTGVWAAFFTLTAVVLFCVQHWTPENTALLVACKIAGFTVPAVFTARYPEAARRRYFAEHGIPESAYEVTR